MRQNQTKIYLYTHISNKYSGDSLIEKQRHQEPIDYVKKTKKFASKTVAFGMATTVGVTGTGAPIVKADATNIVKQAIETQLSQKAKEAYTTVIGRNKSDLGKIADENGWASLTVRVSVDASKNSVDVKIVAHTTGWRDDVPLGNAEFNPKKLGSSYKVELKDLNQLKELMKTSKVSGVAEEVTYDRPLDSIAEAVYTKTASALPTQNDWYKIAYTETGHWDSFMQKLNFNGRTPSEVQKVFNPILEQK